MQSAEVPIFKLMHQKYAISPTHLTELEIKSYISYAHHTGYDEANKPEHLFTTKPGKLWDDYCELGEDEIRVRIWECEYKGKNYVLTDINSWPGDNEGGCIVFNNDVVYYNGDQDLESTESCPDFDYNFTNHFCQIRIDTEDDQKIHDNHVLQLELVESQYKKLVDKYKHEFTEIDSKTYQWTYHDQKYIIIVEKHEYLKVAYLCFENKKLLAFTDEYADSKNINIKIIQKLHKRGPTYICLREKYCYYIN
jgi:hypothetical protein